MGADKNFSEKFWPSPKITTKDSHTSLPKSYSHNGPTNPRNKSHSKPRRSTTTRAKDLRQSAGHRPTGGGGLSAWVQADRSRVGHGPFQNCVPI
jgi:hypothetical protein